MRSGPTETAPPSAAGDFGDGEGSASLPQSLLVDHRWRSSGSQDVGAEHAGGDWLARRCTGRFPRTIEVCVRADYSADILYAEAERGNARAAIRGADCGRAPSIST